MTTMHHMNMDEILDLADEIRADNLWMSKIEALEAAQELYPTLIREAEEWNVMASSQMMRVMLGGDCTPFGVMNEMFSDEVS